MNKDFNNSLSGTVVLNDILFPYRVSAAPASKAVYSCVLNVYITDPETGCRMQDEAKKNGAIAKLQDYIDNIAEHNPIALVTTIKEHEKIEKIKAGKIKYDIVKSRYLTHADETPEKVRRIAYECAGQLYADNSRDLLKKLKIKPEIGKQDSAQLYQRYSKDFFKKASHVSSGTLKNYESVLHGACSALIGKPVCDLDDEDIRKLFKEKRYVQMKTLIMKFFDYCQDQGAYLGANPISNFLDQNELGKAKGAKKVYNEEVSHIPIDEERNLHALMEAHLDDKEIMAVILAKCFKMPFNSILNLTWEYIHIQDGQVVIYDRKDQTSGSFHDFTRPVLREGSDLIIEKRKRLIEYYGSEDAIKSKRVVPINKIKSNGIETDADIKSAVSKYVRNILILSGLSVEWINSTVPVTKAPGGSGIALLHSHYNYVLSERCGIALNSPEGKFLRGMIPGGTTHGHYRSMSDSVSGIPYFITVMRRDDIFVKKETDISQKCHVENGTTIVEIPSYGPGQRTHGIIPSTFIPKGTRICIKSKYGVNGEIKFRKNNENANILDINILY